MGGDKGKYYSRSKKVNGRIVREYVGSSYVARLSAQLDEIERERRQLAKANAKFAMDCADALDASLKEFEDLAELIAKLALVATGHHQHQRSEWRRRRARKENGTC